MQDESICGGGGSYSDGQIWAPDRDRTLAATMQLTGDVRWYRAAFWVG